MELRLRRWLSKAIAGLGTAPAAVAVWLFGSSSQRLALETHCMDEKELTSGLP